MRNVKVAVCGAPLVGKRALLEALDDGLLHKKLSVEVLECSERILSLTISRRVEVPRGREEVVLFCFQSTSGPVFRHGEVTGMILRDADIVLYMFAVPFHLEDEAWQVDYYQKHRAIASSLGVNEGEVPWIYLLNKVDLALPDHSNDWLPSKAAGIIVEVSALHKRGLSEVWDALLAAAENRD